MPKRNATAAIIGAGDYIGAEIAKRFAAEGFSIFAGRRNGDKLQMTIKALTYVQQGRGRLDEFFAGKSVDLELAREVFAEIERRRAAGG